MTYVTAQVKSKVEGIVQDAAEPNLPPPSPSSPVVASPTPANPTFGECAAPLFCCSLVFTFWCPYQARE